MSSYEFVQISHVVKYINIAMRSGLASDMEQSKFSVLKC